MKKPNLGNDNPGAAYQATPEQLKAMEQLAEIEKLISSDRETLEPDYFELMLSNTERLYELYHKMHSNGHANYAKTIRKHLDFFIKMLEECEFGTE